MLTSQEKRRALLDLTGKRKSARINGYACLADIHGGIYECDHVSPWTKSGNNVDADVMVIGQDWASADMLAKRPEHVTELGYDPRLKTNTNLNDLLGRHLRLQRADCYLTNLFVFIKGGKGSASIPPEHLDWSAKNFTIPEIDIVSPTLVVCLGHQTFCALARAAGRNAPQKIAEAIASPFAIGPSQVHCVAHTGALGTLNRSKEQVERDWKALGMVLAQTRAAGLA